MITLHLYVNSLRELLRPARVAVTAILTALPALVALLIRVSAGDQFDGVAVYNALASLLVFGFVLVILSVVFGTGVVSQEMEQKTMVYLLTRPVARWRILLAKFCAAITAITATVWLASLLLAAATLTRGSTSGATTLHATSFRDLRAFAQKLQFPIDPVSSYLRDRLPEPTRDRLDKWNATARMPRRLQRDIVRGINGVLGDGQPLHDAERFAGVQLDNETRELLAQQPRGATRMRLNRWLLEAAYPNDIVSGRSGVRRLPRDLMILPLGAVAYAGLFLFLATLTSRGLIVGLVFAFGWESWVPLLPGSFRLVSVMSYLRVLAPHGNVEAAGDVFATLMPAIAQEVITTQTAWWALGATAATALASAVLLFSIREYVPREDAA